jgi:hypothetical protein
VERGAGVRYASHAQKTGSHVQKDGPEDPSLMVEVTETCFIQFAAGCGCHATARANTPHCRRGPAEHVQKETCGNARRMRRLQRNPTKRHVVSHLHSSSRSGDADPISASD